MFLSARRLGAKRAFRARAFHNAFRSALTAGAFITRERQGEDGEGSRVRAFCAYTRLNRCPINVFRNCPRGRQRDVRGDRENLVDGSDFLDNSIIRATRPADKFTTNDNRGNRSEPRSVSLAILIGEAHRRPSTAIFQRKIDRSVASMRLSIAHSVPLYKIMIERSNWTSRRGKQQQSAADFRFRSPCNLDQIYD